MTKTRKRFKSEFKAKVALTALKEFKTLNELSKEYGVHSNQISKWKRELLARSHELFSTKKRGVDEVQNEELKARLYQEIGQLKVELDWFKKKVGY